MAIKTTAIGLAFCGVPSAALSTGCFFHNKYNGNEVKNQIDIPNSPEEDVDGEPAPVESEKQKSDSTEEINTERNNKKEEVAIEDPDAGKTEELDTESDPEEETEAPSVPTEPPQNVDSQQTATDKVDGDGIDSTPVVVKEKKESPKEDKAPDVEQKNKST